MFGETMFEINAASQPFPAKPYPDRPLVDDWSDTDTGTRGSGTLSSTLASTLATGASTGRTSASDFPDDASESSLRVLARYVGGRYMGAIPEDDRSDTSLMALGRYMGCACDVRRLEGRELLLPRAGGPRDGDDDSALTVDEDAAHPGRGDEGPGGMEVRLEDTALAPPAEAAVVTPPLSPATKSRKKSKEGAGDVRKVTFRINTAWRGAEEGGTTGLTLEEMATPVAGSAKRNAAPVQPEGLAPVKAKEALVTTEENAAPISDAEPCARPETDVKREGKRGGKKKSKKAGKKKDEKDKKSSKRGKAEVGAVADAAEDGTMGIEGSGQGLISDAELYALLGEDSDGMPLDREEAPGCLLSSPVQKSDEEGLGWLLAEGSETEWDARLRELAAFERERGHCEVPLKHPGGLGRWVRDRLDPRRIRELEAECAGDGAEEGPADGEEGETPTATEGGGEAGRPREEEGEDRPGRAGESKASREGAKGKVCASETDPERAAEAQGREMERRLSELAADLRRIHGEEVASLRRELREQGAQLEGLREEVRSLRGQLNRAVGES